MRTVWPALLLLLCAGLARAQTWERLGPPGGMVISLAVGGDAVYLGTADGHVFASMDGGEHWELRGRAGGRLDGVAQRIVTDRGKAKRLLCAVWFRDVPGGGVFESLDGARSWKLVGLEDQAVRALEHSESAPKVWVAGTRSGVFRSDDDAKTWRRITPSDDPELQNVDSLAIDPRDAETIYVGTYHLPWKSKDGGKTWNPIAAGMIDDSDIMSLLIDSQNPQRIFSSACSGIYRSDDGGANWVKLQGIPYSSRRTQQIVQDPVDARSLYAATTEGLWATSDYGETWKRITRREMDANAVAVLAAEKEHRILAGFDAQGVLRSDDGGASFTESNAGFLHRVIFSLASDPQEPAHFLARVEDSPGRLLETRDSGTSWTEFPAPPAGKAVERLFASNAGWWATFLEGGIARYDKETGKWRETRFRETTPVSAASRKASRGRMSARFQTSTPRVNSFAELSGEAFAATDDGLWRYLPRSFTFEPVPAKGLPRQIIYISPAPGDSLLGIAVNSIWIGENHGSVWTRAASPPEAGSLHWVLRRQEGESKELLVGTQRGVFVSGGSAGWRLVANGLPAVASKSPAQCGETCILAMDNGGLYLSSDDGRSWRRLDADAEQGNAAAVILPGRNVVVVASQSEGVLRVRW